MKRKHKTKRNEMKDCFTFTPPCMMDAREHKYYPGRTKGAIARLLQNAERREKTKAINEYAAEQPDGATKGRHVIIPRTNSNDYEIRN